MSSTTDSPTDLVRSGLARWYRGRLIPIIRGGSGEAGEGGGEGEGGEGAQGGEGASGNGGQGGADKTFSQADVDRIVQERVARAKTTPPADYAELKKKAEEFDKLQDEQKTELERERAAREKAEQASNDAIARANARLIEAAVLTEATAQKALKPEHMHRLIDTDQVTVGDDGQVTGAKEAVTAFLEANPEYVGTSRPNGSADQGARGGAPNQLTREQLKTMTPEAIVAARAEGRTAHIEGRT